MAAASGTRSSRFNYIGSEVPLQNILGSTICHIVYAGIRNVDKPARLTISFHLSNSTKMTTNTETAMLSTVMWRLVTAVAVVDNCCQLFVVN